MNVLLPTLAAYTGLGLLVASGIDHTRHPRAFRAALRRHAVWPRWLVVSLAAIVTLLELSIGLLGLAASADLTGVKDSPLLHQVVLLAAGILYIAFGCYGLFLLVRRPGVPCACAGVGHATNIWVPTRALVMAVGCLAAAWDTAHVLPASATSEFAVSLLGSACFLVLLWNLPIALHNPQTRMSASVTPTPMDHIPAHGQRH